MTWMIIRLVLTLAFVGGVLLFAARLAKKRGLGQSTGLIEVVARQRMGRTSTLNVVRIADVVLVVGATEEHVTLLAEVDSDSIDAALRERAPVRLATAPDSAGDDSPTLVARSPSTGVLAGSVLDRQGWGTLVDQMRERTVRRS
ncbi:FliO/MopB family protein [Blastococcus sp. SYSU DS0617]